MSTNQSTAPTADMAKLITELREPLEIPENHISVRILAETDPLYEEPAVTRTRHASELREERLPEFRAALAEGKEEWAGFVRLYTLDGERISSRLGDWDGMVDALPGMPGPTRHHFYNTPNAVALHDDLIYVSDGNHLVTEVKVDDEGDEFFTFLSFAGYKQKEEDERAAALTVVMPAARAAAPTWAAPLTTDDFNIWPDEVEVIYTSPAHLTHGTAHLTQLGEGRDNTVTLKGEPDIYIYVEEKTKWTPALVRELAADMLEFANYIESAIGGE